MDGIDGKVIAITGASGGVGEAAARHLAGRGAKLVLGARRLDRLEALADELGALGAEVAVLRVDVTRRADAAALVDLALERFGRLDVLVANAGVAWVAPLDAADEEAWEAMVDVNLRGVLHGIAAALPTFRRQGAGQLVAVASTAGLKVVPNMAVYAATKHAVRALVDGLRQESGPDVRVALITPGAIDTPFVEASAGPEVRERFAQLAAIAMDPLAVARAMAYVIEQPPEVEVGEVVLRATAQA